MDEVIITKAEAKLLSTIINMEFNDGCDWTVDDIHLPTLQKKLTLAQAKE